MTKEYSASEIRKILQQLFPRRQLVLSQFTFFLQSGVACPTGETFRRGRRCYHLEDLLSIASILALKEEGIPLKNIPDAPRLIQQEMKRIFQFQETCRIMGCGEKIGIRYSNEIQPFAFEDFAGNGENPMLFWSLDLSIVARQLRQIAESNEVQEPVRKAA